GPDDDRDQRPQMTNHRHETCPRAATMNIAIPATGRSKRRAQIIAHRIKYRFAERQSTGCIPNKRRENIAFSQGQSRSCAQRLLPTSEENAPMHFPHAIKAGELIVQDPRQQHYTISMDVMLTKRKTLLNRTVTQHSL